MPPAASVDRTAYEIALQAWVQSQMPTGQPCIYEDTDGPDPDAFATIKVTTLSPVGRNTLRVLDEPFEGKFKGELQRHYRGTCSLQVHGKGARALIEAIKVSMFLPDVQLVNCEARLYLEDSGDTVDLTGIVGVRSRPSFQADIFFHWSEVTPYAADVIETANPPGS